VLWRSDGKYTLKERWNGRLWKGEEESVPSRPGNDNTQQPNLKPQIKRDSAPILVPDPNTKDDVPLKDVPRSSSAKRRTLTGQLWWKEQEASTSSLVQTLTKTTRNSKLAEDIDGIGRAI